MERLGLDPASDPNYVESGQGMGATITLADEQKAYLPDGQRNLA